MLNEKRDHFPFFTTTSTSRTDRTITCRLRQVLSYNRTKIFHFVVHYDIMLSHNINIALDMYKTTLLGDDAGGDTYKQCINK
jgi:hypothetical protein